jgi:hypothetical protein
VTTLRRRPILQPSVPKPCDTVGAIIAERAATTVVTVDLVETDFGLRCIIVADSVTDTPQVVPLGCNRTTADQPNSCPGNSGLRSDF